MPAPDDKRRVDAFWKGHVLAHPPHGWEVRAGCFVMRTPGHIGVVSLGQRQVEGVRLFAVDGRVASRVLSDAHDARFPPRPDERDSAAWHWSRDMHSLTNGAVGPYLSLPSTTSSEEADGLGEAVRDVAVDVVAPAVQSHMNDEALLADRRCVPPLRLGNYRICYEMAHLAASLGQTDVLEQVRASFREALRQRDATLDVVTVLERDAQRIEALSGN